MGILFLDTKEASGKDKTKKYEGWRENIYKDTKGIKTTGYGFNLEDPVTSSMINPEVVSGKRKITKEEADVVFDKRYSQAEKDAKSYLGKEAFDKLDSDVKNVLVDMSYNMGLPKLNTFVKFKSAILKGDMGASAEELKNSKWYNQVGDRSKDHYNLIKSKVKKEAPEEDKGFNFLEWIEGLVASDAEGAQGGGGIRFLDINEELNEKKGGVRFLDEVDLGEAKIVEAGTEPEKGGSLSYEQAMRQEEEEKQAMVSLAIMKEQQKQAEEADPRNWSLEKTEQYIKDNPPQDVESQARQEVMLDEKKRTQEQAKAMMLPWGHPDQMKVVEEEFERIGQEKLNTRAKTSSAPPEHIAEWVKKGPIKADEQFWSRQDKTEMIPVAGTVESSVKAVKLLMAVQRIQADNYEEDPDDKSKAIEAKAKDLADVREFLVKIEEERVRGYTIPARITQGLGQLPAFIGEYMLTGPGATAGKEAIKRGAVKVVGKLAKKKAVNVGIKGLQLAAGAGARTALTPQRVVEAYAKRRITALGPRLTKEGVDTLPPEQIEEKPFTSAMKAYGDVFIEYLSEDTGAAIGKIATKGFSKVMPKKAVKVLKEAFEELHPGEKISKIFTKAGYHGFLEEMGEERLGDLLRAVTGVNDFGAKDGSVFDRVVASIPNGEELLVEAGVLSVPGATQAIASGVSKIKRISPEVPVKEPVKSQKEIIKKEKKEKPFRKSRVPQFENTNKALEYGEMIKDKPNQIKDLESELELLNSQYKLFLKQGKEAEALALASGQKQFVREALDVARGKIDKKKVDEVKFAKMEGLKSEKDKFEKLEEIKKTLKKVETEELEKHIESRYEQGATQGELDLLEEAYAERISEESPGFLEELEDDFSNIEGVPSVEELLANMYVRYIGKSEWGAQGMSKEQMISNMRANLEDFVKKDTSSIPDEEILNAAKDLYESKQALIERRKKKVEPVKSELTTKSSKSSLKGKQGIGEPNVSRETLSKVKNVEQVKKQDTGKEKIKASNWEIEMSKEAKTPKKINKTQIVSWVEKAFKIPIRGKVTHQMRKAEGHYERNPELVRLKRWGELPVVAHEVAHHIDKKMMKTLNQRWANPAWRRAFVPGGSQKEATNELESLDYDQSKRRTTEGFAEFMRHLLTTNQAPERAPVFYKFFVDQFLKKDNPALGKKIFMLKKMMSTWQDQGAENRILQHVDFKGEHTKVKGVRSKVIKAKEWVLKNYDDKFYYINKLTEQVEDITGKKLKPSESPKELAKYMASRSTIVARTMVEEAMVDEYGNIVGPGLTEIVKPITDKEMNSFISYWIARRAKNLSSRGIESGFDIDDVNYVLEKHQNDKWDDTITKLTKWNEGVMDWLIRAGGLGQEEADIIRELNPVYLPFKRAFLDEMQIVKGTGQIVNQGSAVKKIKGSGRPIVNPFESMIAQASETIQRAGKIRLANSIADIAEKEGMGGFITKVPPPKNVTVMSVEMLKSQLQSLVGKQQGAIGQFDLGEIDSLDINEMVSFFTKASSYQGKDNIVSIWRDGKRQFYELHPDLYQALSGVDVLKRGPVLKVLSPFARMLRLGATGLKISFGLGTNPWRDALFTATTSNRDFPIPFFDSARGVVMETLSKPGDKNWRFRKMGGELAGMMGYDRAATQAVYDEMLLNRLGAKGKVLKVVKHPIDSLRGLLSFTELAPRSTEFAGMYKKYRKQHPEWNEEDVFIKAVNDAKDVSIDFTKSGYHAQRINESNAFFNASIRDVEKIFRSFKEHPVRFVTRGLGYLTLPSLALYAANHDKEWYKNLPLAYKYSNFFFEIGDDVIRLPIPFGPGMLFVSAPLAAMDYYKENDKEAFDGLMEVAKGQLPGIIPSMLGPVWDVARNKNWLDKPIESRRMQFLPVERRVKPYTLPVATKLAKVFNKFDLKLSPIQVEYLLHSYTGGGLRQIIPREVKTKSDTPIVGRFFLRNKNNPVRQINAFFVDHERLQQRKTAKMAAPEELKRYKKLVPVYTKLTRKYFKNLRRLNDKDAPRKQIDAIYEQIRLQLEKVGYK